MNSIEQFTDCSQIKPKHLKDLKLELSSPSNTTKVGLLERKHTAYDVWSLGDDHPEHVGGEEIKGLTSLLPRKRKGGKLQRGKLVMSIHVLECLSQGVFSAPKPITRHFVVTARPAQAGTDPAGSASTDIPSNQPSGPPYQNPPRFRHPQSALKHRFMPVGSLVPDETLAPMDVDNERPPAVDATHAVAPPSPAKSQGIQSPSKKRKVGGDDAPREA